MYIYIYKLEEESIQGIRRRHVPSSIRLITVSGPPLLNISITI